MLLEMVHEGAVGVLTREVAVLEHEFVDRRVVGDMLRRAQGRIGSLTTPSYRLFFVRSTLFCIN